LSSARTILLFELGNALGHAICDRHGRNVADDAWSRLLDRALEISDHDPEVLSIVQDVRLAVDDLVSPAATHLYAEWTAQNVTSEAAKALLDGISCAAPRGPDLTRRRRAQR